MFLVIFGTKCKAKFTRFFQTQALQAMQWRHSRHFEGELKATQGSICRNRAVWQHQPPTSSVSACVEFVVVNIDVIYVYPEAENESTYQVNRCLLHRLVTVKQVLFSLLLVSSFLLCSVRGTATTVYLLLFFSKRRRTNQTHTKNNTTHLWLCSYVIKH